MYSPKPWHVLLLLCCLSPIPQALAQAVKPAGEDEVAELRREIAELKAQIQALQSAQANAPAPAAAAAPAPAAPQASQAAVDKLQKQVDTLQAKANQPPTSGWNGEHFFLRSTDGTFNLMPTGYLTGQYGVYNNTYGAPPDSFAISRARIGFEGNYGKQLDFVMNIETISSPTVRDAYLDFKPANEFKLMAGQMKVPFSMEVGTADTAVDFANRSIIGVLYPDASGSNRAPGIDAHGDFSHGAVQYWLGVFNGQGILTSGTTNEAEGEAGHHLGHGLQRDAEGQAPRLLDQSCGHLRQVRSPRQLGADVGRLARGR